MPLNERLENDCPAWRHFGMTDRCRCYEADIKDETYSKRSLPSIETKCLNKTNNVSDNCNSSSTMSDNSTSLCGGCGDQVGDDFPSMSVLSQNMPQVKTLAISDDQKLLELLKRTGYEMIQRNGQRIYGGPPPNWKGAPPPKGSEVFVGKVPRDCFEWELVPIFEKIGPIYELRLMMDFSGSNRGYLFVRFTCVADAKRAIRDLNNYEIRRNQFIGVMNSVDNRKLWISGIPKNRTAEEIKSEMEKITDGVRNVILYPSQVDKSKMRGYAFVEYETHRAAALARRKLVPGRNFIFDQEIDKVDWAEPENEVDEEVMAKVKVLFVRNLMLTTTEDKISLLFAQISNGHVERVKKHRDYAFVHFVNRDDAEKAFEATRNGLVIDNSTVDVSWSKPIDRQIHNQRKQLTRVLTSPLTTAPIHEMPPAIPTAMHPTTMVQNYYDRENFAPRPRGAAGIKGLVQGPSALPSKPPSGAPGTAPPRGLVRRLTSGQGMTAGRDPNFNVVQHMLANNKMFFVEPCAYMPAGPPSSPTTGPVNFFPAAGQPPNVAAQGAVAAMTAGPFQPGRFFAPPPPVNAIQSQVFFMGMQ